MIRHIRQVEKETDVVGLLHHIYFFTFQRRGEESNSIQLTPASLNAAVKEAPVCTIRAADV